MSVVIPVFNGGRFIRQAVESVFEQKTPSVEVIVVDDGSTDDTCQALEPLHGRIRYAYQDNQGAPAARNHGLQLARGEFIGFLDADDYFLPGKLDGQLEFLRRRPRLGIVHSGWRVVGPEGDDRGVVEPWHEAPRLDLKGWLLWKPVFLGAMLFRRSWFDRAGGFDVRLRQTDDVEMMLRLAYLGCRADWLRRPTVCYRQHSTNITLDGTSQAGDLEAALNMFFALPHVPWRIRRLELRVRYYTLLWIAWNLWRTGHIVSLTDCLHRSLAYCPRPPETIAFEWMGHLAKWQRQQGRSVDELEQVWPHFRSALPAEAGTWGVLALALRWWLHVWWRYHDGEALDGQTLLRLSQGLTPRQLAKLIQTSLWVEVTASDLQAVDRLWSDLRSVGRLPPEEDFEVTTVYLTLFTQAIFHRRLSLAGRSLARSLRHGFRLRAWPAWARFFRAAVEYGLGRPRSDPGPSPWTSVKDS